MINTETINEGAKKNLEMLMVNLQSGSIDLRDDRTKEKWTVAIEPFYIAKYPVTQEFYREITSESPSTFKGAQKPVETITWKESIIFCNKLSEREGLDPCYRLDENSEHISFDNEANGYRLPTEAEWEYACRAGSKEIRYGDLKDIAWYKANSINQTHDVGRKEPNDWGLYDLLGNVWEWCSDVYDETVYGSYRIFRGGGWCDEERSVMATTRRRSHPLKFKIDDLGFRIARNGS